VHFDSGLQCCTTAWSPSSRCASHGASRCGQGGRGGSRLISLLENLPCRLRVRRQSTHREAFPRQRGAPCRPTERLSSTDSPSRRTSRRSSRRRSSRHAAHLSPRPRFSRRSWASISTRCRSNRPSLRLSCRRSHRHSYHQTHHPGHQRDSRHQRAHQVAA
jgi:hypothetical protein